MCVWLFFKHYSIFNGRINSFKNNLILLNFYSYFFFFFVWNFIADNANNEIGASNDCATEDLAKEMKNQKV